MAEIKEKFCADCKHEYKSASEYPCNECCNAYTSKFEGKTNFDIIKEMSVGELAEFLVSMQSCSKDIEEIEKWLEREVGNDG